MVHADWWIREMSLGSEKMIEPFAEGKSRPGTISYGLSSYGYDMRISNEFKVLKKTAEVVDPKEMKNPDYETTIVDSYFEIPPNTTAFGRSVEYFRIPRKILTIEFGKSTYARCGIIINLTPFEPEWEGFVTIAITNTNQHPVKIYANEGIAQVLFLEGAEGCEKSYADKKGKYQAQKGITMARIDE